MAKNSLALTLNNKVKIKLHLEENRCIHVSNGSNCWEYLGHIGSAGYGVMGINYAIYRVNRISMYIYRNFDLNSPLLICHIPECKMKSYFNPDHLYIGTFKNNQEDIIKTGTNFHANKTHCKNGHEFNKKNTVITDRGRKCKTCDNLRAKKYRAEMKASLQQAIKNVKL